MKVAELIRHLQRYESDHDDLEVLLGEETVESAERTAISESTTDFGLKTGFLDADGMLKSRPTHASGLRVLVIYSKV